MNEADAPTPSEVRASALFDLTKRAETIERLMSRIDAMVYRDETPSLDNLDACVGEIAAAINALAGVVYTLVEEDE